MTARNLFEASILVPPFKRAFRTDQDIGDVLHVAYLGVAASDF